MSAMRKDPDTRARIAEQKALRYRAEAVAVKSKKVWRLLRAHDLLTESLPDYDTESEERFALEETLEVVGTLLSRRGAPLALPEPVPECDPAVLERPIELKAVRDESA